jgi:hypothetical protein
MTTLDMIPMKAEHGSMKLFKREFIVHVDRLELSFERMEEGVVTFLRH